MDNHYGAGIQHHDGKQPRKRRGIHERCLRHLLCFLCELYRHCAMTLHCLRQTVYPLAPRVTSTLSVNCFRRADRQSTVHLVLSFMKFLQPTRLTFPVYVTWAREVIYIVPRSCLQEDESSFEIRCTFLMTGSRERIEG
jgi:hypothetical protein